MWTYRSNYMGPINKEFIATHGENWAGGRIDCRCDDIKDPDYDRYGQEIGIPTMNLTHYNILSKWLENLRTDRLLTEEELYALFKEQTKVDIKFFKEDDYE